MRLYKKIDTTTGNFIEDCLFDSQPLLEDGTPDLQYVLDDVPQGFYLPRWNGEAWVEGGQAPEPTPQEPTELELLMLAVAELDMQRELDRTENQIAIAELAEPLIGGY